MTAPTTEGRSDGEIYAAAVPTPAEIMADVQKRSLVMRVTNAYESGMGRGLSGRDLSQPYEPTCEEGIAYALGWYQGRSKQSPEPSEQWQPMESAPSEGRMILAWYPHNKCCYIISRYKPEDEWDGGPGRFAGHQPSCWMKIPTPETKSALPNAHNPEKGDKHD